MAFDHPVELKVWAPPEQPFGCFTRPDMKVERVSYPVMTPSAARGVLEAVFWKPEFQWRVREILVLNPIAWYPILRNEISTPQSDRGARGWEKSGGGYFASEDRTQRNTLALRDVAYIIRATVEPHDGSPANEAKYRDQFRRRVDRGQCYAMPYLGCREFTAAFGPVEGNEVSTAGSMDLGRMLYDLEFTPGGNGAATPYFFRAHMQDGLIQVPSWEEVKHAP